MTGLVDVGALFDLSGRVAVVTGGASGIGAEISTHLASAHARVVVLDRNGELAAEKARTLNAAGGSASAACIDITEETAVVEGFAALVSAVGTPYLLVNNAGIQDRQNLLDTSGEEWDRIQNVNLRGAFFCLRETARAMKAAGRGGRIVNIASLGVLHPMIHGLAAYSASKGGLITLTRNAAFELAEHGITVNAVLPGGVDTPGARSATGPIPQGPIPAMRGAPLGTCTAADMALAVLFFASPAAQRITAQNLAVEGGFLLN
jgi:NAD(P)-dependent dehydrogenase (short-subunit alcohol dehydrogenase family)